ncbi:MAG: hypothetical protein ABSC60_10090 [Acidobacteriota bacterium]
MKTFPIPYIASPVNYSYATIRILILVILIPSVYGEGPNFEVASIKPAPPIDPGQFMDTRCHGGPGTKDPGRWTCANISLLSFKGSVHYRREGPGRHHRGAVLALTLNV